MSSENKDIENRNKRVKERKIADMGSVLATKQGRRLMRDILANSGIYRCSISEVEHMTYFNEGRRSLGLDYLAIINAHFPERYVQMNQEYMSEVRQNKEIEDV